MAPSARESIRPGSHRVAFTSGSLTLLCRLQALRSEANGWATRMTRCRLGAQGDNSQILKNGRISHPSEIGAKAAERGGQSSRSSECTCQVCDE